MPESEEALPSCADGGEKKPQKSPLDLMAQEMGCDIMVYSGPIARDWDSRVIDTCRESKRCDSLLLLLNTLGGDPDAAYRIASYLQQCYQHLSIFVVGQCKSAGTLMTLGAQEIIMGDHGELGPLDIQMAKRDELGEMHSGLLIGSAIDHLCERAYGAFERFMLYTKIRSQQMVTFHTATRVAVELTVGLFAPIMAQIDPAQVGEAGRAMGIALDYGERLAKYSGNLGEEGMLRLLNGYPSHGFVIDRREAQTLFNHVREPNALEYELEKQLGQLVRQEQESFDGTPIFWFGKGGQDDAQENETDAPGNSGEAGPRQNHNPRRDTGSAGEGAADVSEAANGEADLETGDESTGLVAHGE